MPALNSWLDTPLGQHVLAREQAYFDQAVADVFGYHAVQFGLPDQPLLPGAIFAENIPIPETRDYVKRVLANATVYAAILSGKPQSLKARLGDVGSPDAMLASNQGNRP